MTIPNRCHCPCPQCPAIFERYRRGKCFPWPLSHSGWSLLSWSEETGEKSLSASCQHNHRALSTCKTIHVEREGEERRGWGRERGERETEKEIEKMPPSYVTPKFPLWVWRYHMLLLDKHSKVAGRGCYGNSSSDPLVLIWVRIRLSFQGFTGSSYMCHRHSHSLSAQPQTWTFYSIRSPVPSPLSVTLDATWSSVAYEPLRNFVHQGPDYYWPKRFNISFQWGFTSP